MDIREWQKSLEDNFTYNGIPGGRILPSTIEQERICGTYYIRKFHGHRVLAESFLNSFATTLRSAGEIRLAGTSLLSDLPRRINHPIPNSDACVPPSFYP